MIPAIHSCKGVWNLILFWIPDFWPLISLVLSYTLNITCSSFTNFTGKVFFDDIHHFKICFSFEIHNTQESSDYLFDDLRKICYKHWKTCLWDEFSAFSTCNDLKLVPLIYVFVSKSKFTASTIDSADVLLIYVLWRTCKYCFVIGSSMCWQ